MTHNNMIHNKADDISSFSTRFLPWPIQTDIDNQGQSTDNKVHSTDNKGQSTDNKGHSIDIKGQSTDNKGHSIDIKGQSISELIFVPLHQKAKISLHRSTRAVHDFRSKQTTVLIANSRYWYHMWSK